MAAGDIYSFLKIIMMLLFHAHKICIYRKKKLLWPLLCIRMCFTYHNQSAGSAGRHLAPDEIRVSLVTPLQSGFWNGQTVTPPLGLVGVCILPWWSRNKAPPRKTPTGPPGYWPERPQERTESRWTWEIRFGKQNLESMMTLIWSSRQLKKLWRDVVFGSGEDFVGLRSTNQQQDRFWPKHWKMTLC